MPRYQKPPEPVVSKDDIHVVAGPEPGPAVDEAMLRDFVESEARKDAASDMYDVNLGAHGHSLIMEHKIDRWHR